MQRRGFTLIELLIVILVMLLITAVTIPAISPALEGRKVREAARMVEVFLNGARNRAIGSGHAVGVIIEPDEFEPSQCVSLSYVEQPEPYAGDFDNSTILVLGNGGFGAWQNEPSLDISGNPIPGVVANDFAFSMNDVGWMSNIAPGDLFFLRDDDTVMYRIYAGEPYIDVNGDGQYTFTAAIKEPFNDVDGNGSYTPPDPSIIDSATGYFKGFPSVTWGTKSAFITYTYADPVLAAQYGMSVRGLAQDAAGNYTMPLFLGFDSRHSAMQKHLHSKDAANNGSAQPRFSFQFIRRPVKTSSATVNLPSGTCIDLGSNYVDQATKNIVGVPGSGLDMIVPFSGGSSTLGNYSTFRPNPLTDHKIIGSGSSSPPVNRPLMITFDPSGIVDMVYSYDERNFITNTSQVGQPVNVTNYQGRLATSPIYLLVGRTELIDGDPELIDTLKNGAAPQKPIFNLQDPGSLWVSVNQKTGLISTTENVAPDLTVAPPAIQTPASPLIQLYFNVQAYQGRSLARGASDMGGM